MCLWCHVQLLHQLPSWDLRSQLKRHSGYSVGGRLHWPPKSYVGVQFETVHTASVKHLSSAGSFRSWSHAVGNGFVLFSGWATQLPDLDIKWVIFSFSGMTLMTLKLRIHCCAFYPTPSLRESFTSLSDESLVCLHFKRQFQERSACWSAGCSLLVFHPRHWQSTSDPNW